MLCRPTDRIHASASIDQRKRKWAPGRWTTPQRGCESARLFTEGVGSYPSPGIAAVVFGGWPGLPVQPALYGVVLKASLAACPICRISSGAPVSSGAHRSGGPRAPTRTAAAVPRTSLRSVRLAAADRDPNRQVAAAPLDEPVVACRRNAVVLLDVAVGVVDELVGFAADGRARQPVRLRRVAGVRRHIDVRADRAGLRLQIARRVVRVGEGALRDAAELRRRRCQPAQRVERHNFSRYRHEVTRWPTRSIWPTS